MSSNHSRTMKTLFRFIWISILFSTVFAGQVFAAGDMQPVSFTDSRDPVPSNGEVNYIVELKNNKGDTAEDVELNVTVPDGFTFISVNQADCSYTGDNPSDSNDSDLVECSFGNFSASESREINITLKAPVVEEATVFEANASAYCKDDVNTANDSEIVKTTVTKGADLSLTKTSIPNPAVSSGIVTYEMNVTNNGPHKATGLVLTDTLPGVLEFYADNASPSDANDSNWTCHTSGGPQNVTCTGIDIAVGATSSFHFRVKITGADTGVVTNAATVESDVLEVNTSDNTDTDDLNILPGTDISVEKKVVTNPVIEEQNVTFEINVSNLGKHPAEDVVMEDILMDGYTVVEIDATGWDCSQSVDTNVTCTKDNNLSAGDSSIITIKATAPDIPNPQARTDENNVSVSTATDDPISSNDKDRVIYTVWADQADLELSKSKSPTPLAVGDIATSTILVHNNGPREADPVQVVDVLDSNEEYVEFSGDNWDCSESDGNVTCDYSQTLVMGKNAKPLYIKTKILAEDDDISNRACTGGSGATDEPGYGDTYEANDCDSAGIGATDRNGMGVADIRVIKTASDNTIDPNENNFTYHISIKNIEGNTSTDVKFRDRVPEYIEAFEGRPATGLTLNSNEIDVDHNCTITDGQVECNLGDLNLNDEVNISILVERPMRDGFHTNTASAYSTEIGDTNRTNNQDSATVTVNNVAEIELVSKEVTPNDILAGTEATYTITIRNNGPSLAEDVNVSDVFSGEDFTFISATTSRGDTCSYDEANRELNCTLGDMTYKDAESITVKIRPDHLIPEPANWEINNTARVTMKTPDGNLSNNEENATLKVHNGQVDLAIEVDESEDFTEPVSFDPDNDDHNYIVYKVQIDNNGPSYATDVNFSAVVNSVSPDNDQNLTFKYLTANSDGSSDGVDYNCSEEGTTFHPESGAPVITCSIGNMEAGMNYTRYLVLKVENAPHYVTGDVYHIESNVTSREVETLEGNNEEDERTTVRVLTDPSIVKEVSKDTVEVGEAFSYKLIITNNGPGYSPSTNISDTLPEGMVLTGTPTTTQGTCNGNAGETSFSCNVDESDGTLHSKYLDSTQTDEANITVPVMFISYPSSGGDTNATVTNTAYVTTSGPDKNESNNVASVNVTVMKPAHIGDVVWLDRDADGIQDDNGNAIVDMPVYLILDSNNSIVQETKTDANGKYGFDINHSDDYRVEFNTTNFHDLKISPKDAGADDKDSDINASASTEVFHVDYGDNNLTFDAGFYTLVGIGDRVWVDENGNGLQDSGEADVKNVKVILYKDGNSTAQDSVSTDADGKYLFDNLIPGKYYVKFDKSTLPSGYVFTTKQATSAYTKDSNADRTTGKTFTKLVRSDKKPSKHYIYKHFDAGIYIPVSIGDYAWHDVNGNGIQESNESALADVNVTLMDAGCQNMITEDQNNSASFSNPVLTDSNGAYLFENLKPDTYCLKFIAPDGTDYVVTQQDQGDESNDSDPDGFNTPEGVTADYELTSGEDNRSVDAGFYLQIRIGDKVWEDRNYDGIQQSDERNISGVRVYLVVDGDVQDGTNGTVDKHVETNATGEYLFDDLPPGHRYSVKFVLPNGYKFTQQDIGSDDTVDSDANATGYASGETDETASADENLTFDAGIYKPVVIGNYVWEDMDADGVQEGSDRVLSGILVTLVIDGTPQPDINTTTNANGLYRFDDLLPDHNYSVEFTIPSGYYATAQNVGDDQLDSDGDADGKNVASTPTMYSGDVNETLDMGLYQKAAMGNRIWYDDNGNGIQDAGEGNVSGVTVKLYRASDDSLVDTNTTDSNGFYHFTDLRPDKYYVIVSDLPAGYVFTQQNAGGDDQADSDVNVTTGRSDEVTLLSNDDDNSTDAGIYIPVSIGDYAWIDDNGNGVQDAGESALDNVKVQLWNASGQVTKDLNGTTFGTNGTIETNSSGEYLFENLRPDNYYVKFEAPNPYVITLRDQGDDNSDSDTNGTAATSGQTDYYELTSGEDNRSVDAGFYIPVTVGDRVWVDKDYDGIQDSDEENLSDVDVTLYADGDYTTVVATAVTDANGSYLFGGLPAGHTYSVEFNLSNANSVHGTDYRFTLSDQGSDDSDSDANVTNGRTEETPFMGSGDSNLTLDAGVYEPVIIGDKVWHDIDGDGMQGSGEPGINDVLVTLVIDGTLQTDINTTTAGNGDYLFDASYDLKPGHRYSVEFDNPDTTFVFTQANAGSNDLNDSDADASGAGVDPTPVMSSGESNTSLDAGMYHYASIGNRIWLDTDADGVQDAGEENLTGVDVNVTLRTADGTEVSTQTAQDGSYHFDNLVPGDYYVEFTLPAGYEVSPQDAAADDRDSDVNATTLRTATTTLESGENDLSWDMGLYQYASIGNRIWLDTDANGVQDAGENNVTESITVRLYDSADTEIASQTVTDGSYLFTDVVPGDYYVEFTLPAGYEVSPQDEAADDRDSDVNATTLRTATTTLESGENDVTWDMGLYQYASIGNRIWLDTDANGVQDAGENNVTESITVRLYDSADTEIASQTVTDGSYLFTDVVPGDYYVEFTLPAGYVVSPQDETGVNVDDSNDSDVNATTLKTETTVLVSGEEDLSWDMGIFQPAAIGDRIWLDNNGNGVQDAGEGNFTGEVHVYLEDENNASVTDASGNAVGSVTTTDGSYAFTNLVPGTYHVRFEFPADTQRSPLNRGAADSDSDVRHDSNTTADTVLTSGENDTTWDAGVFFHAGIGDKVWIDSNGDGIQNDNETLDINVTVNLYYDSNDSLADTQVVEAGSDGNYSFVNVDPDDYYVEFILPAGSKYRFIAPDAGSDDTVDSDVNITTGRTPVESISSNEFNNTLDAGIYIPASIGNRVWLDANANGIQDVGENNVSDINVTLYDDANNSVATAVTDENGSYLFSGLVPGDYHVEFATTDNNGQAYVVSPQDVVTGADDTNDSDANATGVAPVETLVSREQNTDYDMGLYIPVSIGDLVWSDKDGNGVQNAGEPGIEDVNVTLYREESNGTVTLIGSQDTNSSGGYLFTDLVPGHYYVHVEQPDHFRVTVQNRGNDDAADSDIDRVTGETASFELFSPEDNLTLDAGFYELATIQGNVSEDTDNDDAGDVNLQFVDIALVDSNGVTVQTTQTDINGSYTFIDVEPGDYTVVETQPAGLVSVSENEGGSDNDSGNTALDNIIAVHVNIGEIDIDNDFVEEKSVTIGDRVWNDENGNGVQDAGETNTTGLDGIVVTLYDDQDAVVATTVTDSDGEYLFEDYPEGTYHVGFDLATLPAHYGITRVDQGSDDSNDSDVAIATGITGADYLAPGEDNRTFDMGIYLLGTISGVILEDINDDDIGDRPMAGVTLVLYDENGNEVARTVTAADGTYIFTDLPQGIYTIREMQPAGYLNVAETNGDLRSNDGVENAITVTVNAGEHDGNNDFIEEIGGSIGNYVWQDVNGNGLQDANETGVNAVHVCLEDDQGNAILDANGVQRCTDTNATGYYLFEGILPGDYVVVFTIPTGTTLTPFPQEGTDVTVDSNPTEVINGTASAPVTMGLGEDIDTIDMGLVYLGTASIGDFVWIDENRDGVFDATEAGLDGVTVNLYDTNGNLLETIVTHDGGRYLFEHLYSGSYIVEFIVPKHLEYEFTAAHSGAANLDSDADSKTGRTQEITLREGEHIRVIDAGVYCGCENAPIKANGGNALGLLGMLAMMLMTLITALFFVRKEEQRV